MTTLIKKVEREDIVLDDCYVGQFSWKRFLTLSIVIGLASTYIIYNPIVPQKTLNFSFFNLHILFLSIAVISVLLCVTIIVLGGCQVGVPGYSVSILGDSDSEKCVKKTTPEQDQKAICRITNELEQRAREISKKERDLERIAQGCK